VLVDGVSFEERDPSFPGDILRARVSLRAVEPEQYWRNHERSTSRVSIKKRRISPGSATGPPVAYVNTIKDIWSLFVFFAISKRRSFCWLPEKAGKVNPQCWWTESRFKNEIRHSQAGILEISRSWKLRIHSRDLHPGSLIT